MAQTDSTVDKEITLRAGRGRRAAADVRRAVLTATAELLFDGGIKSVTFEKVAHHAGVSKMTLYKWWPSPGALALEAYFDAVEPELSFPNTGSLADDLRSQLHSFIHLLVDENGGRVMGELVGLAQSDPALASALESTYTRPRRQLAVQRLELARAAGEIRDDVDLQVVVDQLWGAAYHRLLLPAEPLTIAFADALIDNVLRGINNSASS
ncbi:TetR/AcrR family transcriptional regulator [Williamsia sp.]|uniref:TetR/AcrR family transcriptional regulator n=1 Tax=Williamsia sp. TaxID=1872085 RepID=UPI002F93FEB9